MIFFLCLFFLYFLLPSPSPTASIISQILGLLVWTLIAGTEYFRVPAFGWVMFVAVFYWVLTVFFLIVYITMTYTRIPQVPWTTVVRKPGVLRVHCPLGRMERSPPLVDFAFLRTCSGLRN